MKLHDMKVSAPDRQPEVAKQPEASQYPYGLCLHLDSTVLEKLGIKGLPKLGAKVEIHAVCKVVAASMSDSEYGKNRSVSIQIIELGFKGPKLSDKEISDSLYGGK